VLVVRVEAVEVYFKREHLLEGREGTQLGHFKMNLAIDYLNSAIEVSRPRSSLHSGWATLVNTVKNSALLCSPSTCKPCAEDVLGLCHGAEAQSFRKMHQTVEIITRI
jgi:hypothetical protein